MDYGAKTVGVALNDSLGLGAIPYETIWRKDENKLRKTCARLEEIIKEENVECIVLGKPIHMDGSEGERVKKCEIFKKMLERRSGIEVLWVDERLTTVEAREVLVDSGVKEENMKKYVDSVAAALILKDYMSSTDSGK